MSKRLVVTTIGSALAVAGLYLAFIVGAHVGADQAALSQSTARAALLVHELRALRAGKADAVVAQKEIELDGQVLLYARLKAEGHPWLLWPDSESLEHEQYLTKVAAYRKAFPSIIPTLHVQAGGAITREMQAGAAEIAKTTAEIVRAYGD